MTGGLGDLLLKVGPAPPSSCSRKNGEQFRAAQCVMGALPVTVGRRHIVGNWGKGGFWNCSGGCFVGSPLPLWESPPRPHPAPLFPATDKPSSRMGCDLGSVPRGALTLPSGVSLDSCLWFNTHFFKFATAPSRNFTFIRHSSLNVNESIPSLTHRDPSVSRSLRFLLW